MIIIGILILIFLYKIYAKISDFHESFDSWYGDWSKKYDPYIPSYPFSDESVGKEENL